MFKARYSVFTLAGILMTGIANAGGHVPPDGVAARDQDVSNGIVSADTVVSPVTGWLVAHRTDAENTPGAVIGYAPLRAGGNEDVAIILQDSVASGDLLMLMVHGEDGGASTGVFEYTLGATEDGPIRVDGELMMAVIAAQ